jgi:hypothetical protein
MKLSFLEANPISGTPNEEVVFQWQLGDEISQGCTSDDELRLVTNSGTVVARVALRTGLLEGKQVDETYKQAARDTEETGTGTRPRFRSGTCTLRCPPYPGGFVVALVEGGTFKRLIAKPFRVTGPPYIPAQAIHVPAELKPESRMTIECTGADVSEGDVLVLRKSTSGFMSSMEVLEEKALYEGALAVYHLGSGSNCVRIEGGSLRVEGVSPRTEGTYQIHLMSLPLNGVPYVKYSSNDFVVAPSDVRELSPGAETGSMEDFVRGRLRAEKRTVFLGEPLAIQFDFEGNDGNLLSELDTIVLYPYGRSEAVTLSDSLFHTVGEARFSGRIVIPAPLTEGLYDVAYYSVKDQRPLIREESPVKVIAAVATLSHFSEAENVKHQLKKAGKATGGSAALHQLTVPTDGNLVLDFSVDSRVFSPHDRIVVHDELANVVESSFVGSPMERRIQQQLDSNVEVIFGHARIRLYLPGEHIVFYYSSVLKRKIARLPGFVSVNPSLQFSLPVAQLVTLKQWPLGHQVHLGFTKTGTDTRPIGEQGQDCIAVYEEGQPDIIHTHTRDSGGGMAGALFVHYLRGSTSDEAVVPADHPICRTPKRYSLRYLVAVNGHFHRVCTSECRFQVLGTSIPDFEFTGLDNASLLDIGEVQHRFKRKAAAVDNFADTTMSVTDSAPPSQSCSSPQSAHSTRLQGQGLAVNGSVDMVSLQATQLLNQKKVPRFHSNLQFSSPSATEDVLTGAVIPPKIAKTGEHIFVTYSISSGVPRGDDCIVLMTDDKRRLISEVKIQFGNGREDFTMGTVLLLPPLNPGCYLAGYFSDKSKSIVILSDPFRVSGKKPTEREGAGANGEKRPSRSDVKLDRTVSENRPKAKCLLVSVSYLRRPFELKGPLNDCQQFQRAVTNYLRKVGDMETVQSKVLSELSEDPLGVPTAENMRASLRWLLLDLKAKDQAIFYFSGGGSRLPCRERGPDALDNVLLPSDFDWFQRHISYGELASCLFEPARALGVRLTVIIDACFTSNPHDISLQWGLWEEAGLKKVRSLQGQHRGMAAIWKKRTKQGISKQGRWRCVVPPRGMFPRLSTAPDDLHPDSTTGLTGLSTALFQPYTSVDTASESRSGDLSNQLLLYEASQCTEHQPQGAWDVFLEEKGCSVGLFTETLCGLLEEEVQTAERLRRSTTDRPSPMTWWEFHEKVSRKLSISPYGEFQVPRLLVSSVATLGCFVFNSDDDQLNSLVEVFGEPHEGIEEENQVLAIDDQAVSAGQTIAAALVPEPDRERARRPPRTIAFQPS